MNFNLNIFNTILVTSVANCWHVHVAMVLQGHYFLSPISFATSCRYSIMRVGGRRVGYG